MDVDQWTSHLRNEVSTAVRLPFDGDRSAVVLLEIFQLVCQNNSHIYIHCFYPCHKFDVARRVTTGGLP